jgi:hypothetical protein
MPDLLQKCPAFSTKTTFTGKFKIQNLLLLEIYELAQPFIYMLTKLLALKQANTVE